MVHTFGAGLSHSDGPGRQRRDGADLVATRWHHDHRKLSVQAMERQADRLAEEWTTSGSFPRVPHTGGDESLSPELRSFAEHRLGIDVTPVRIHTDERAAGVARSAQASALTVRDHIYFAAGAYESTSQTSRRLLAHELVHVAQQRMSAVAMAQRTGAPTTPREVKDKYLTFFFPDYNGLAADLLGRLPADSKFVNDVFDLMAQSDRAWIANRIATTITNAQVASIASDPGGKAVLWRVFSAMREDSYSGKDFQKDTERLLFAISPQHKHLQEEPWAKSPRVTAALTSSGAKIQSISSGWASGEPQYDEYSVTMDSMPAGLTPEAYLSEMSTDLNKAVNDYWFDVINEFKRTATSAGTPAVGDIYSIDIKGPDNGSVMLVESAPDHFIFQTIATAKDGTHPEYGSREFGFERNPADGSVRFYTRGASRTGMMPGTGLIGRPTQKQGWTRLVTGIGNGLVKRGGKMRAGSITSWRSLDRAM